MRPLKRLSCFSLFILILTLCQPVLADNSDPESSLALKGGEDGTSFESLTVEGEDRIHIEFDRPALKLDLDPMAVRGLDGSSMELMLALSEPDLVEPLLAESARFRSPYLAQPWFAELATGDLVKFRPQLEGVQHWSLLIADSRGDTVIVFKGKKRPPEEIAWNGLNIQGEAALPGPTYSYVLTAWDKAGNKRNFVGEGFELPAYHLETKRGRMILFAASHLGSNKAVIARQDLDPPLLYEVASRLNQEPDLGRTIQIVVKARSYDQAAQLGERVAASLRKHLLGDPARIQTSTEVESNAPEGGVVVILAEAS